MSIGSWWMSKNSRGKKDALLSFSLWAVLATLLKFIANGVTITLATRSFNLGTVDAVLIGAVLVPTLGAYTVKRVKGAKNEPDVPESKP